MLNENDLGGASSDSLFVSLGESARAQRADRNRTLALPGTMRLAVATNVWTRRRALRVAGTVSAVTNAELSVAEAEQLDGSVSLRGLHNNASETAMLAEELYRSGLLVDRSEIEIPALAFYVHLRGYAHNMLHRRGPSPLIKVLWADPSPRLLIGYLVEIYHFVKAAPSHIAPAISTTHGHSQAVLADYLAEEHDHWRSIRLGLTAAGISDSEIERAVPLPGTLAQVNCLRWLASTDVLAYAACLGVGEGDSAGAERAEAFWKRMDAHQLVPTEVIAPFADHEIEDCRAEHAGIAEPIFSERSTLSALEQRRLRRHVTAYCDALLCWHDQTFRHYSEENGPPFYAGREP